MTDQTELEITESAAQHICALLLKEGADNARFRVAVEGGGCSGFQYKFSVDTTPPGNTDQVFMHGEASVVIDDISLQFLNHARLDYVETLGSSGFEISNPNATSACGCGTSFSIV